MDYELQLKIKNAPLLNLMREHGYQNPAELARAMGVPRSGIDHLLSLKIPVYGGNDGNTLTKSAKRLCEFFHVHPEELVPASHIRAPLKQSTFTAQVAENQMKELAQGTKDPAKILEFFQTEQRDAFEDMLEAAKINDREREVLRYRQKDGLTLGETGKKMGVSQERIRQMELKAFRKIRCKSPRQVIEASGIYAAKVGIDS